MGELRDVVWIRPDNLPGERLPEDREVVDAFTRWFTVHPDDDSDLASTLWDLPGWEARAVDLRRSMHALEGRLADGDTDALAPGWLLSAAVLRHFNADPMLPRELLGRRWPGDALRADYDRYDATYKALLGDWLELGRDAEGSGARGGRGGGGGR
jgi:phenylacetic acid degradation operon negative regulatory protein